MTDYYKVLGINNNSNKDEIKKAFKKLALKWHPDRNLNNKIEAEKKFKLISEAYNILGDDKKKMIMILKKILLIYSIIKIIKIL